MVECDTVTTKPTFTLTSLREASGLGLGSSMQPPNAFVFKKFAMHLKRDVLKRK